MRELHCALINLERGAFTQEAVPRDSILDFGSYDFARLQRLMTAASEHAPHIIAICEGWEWGRDGGRPAAYAADLLSEQLGRPYVPLVGWLPQIPSGPVLLYDAALLAVEFWGDRDLPILDRRNLAVLHPRGERGRRFQVKLAIGRISPARRAMRSPRARPATERTRFPRYMRGI